ncbi:hypothetical protein GCM10011575_30670 [Microlunatus endophyticus]|uniref:Putative restriction endonuclease domain-containing protein n=2 Tax=Microlunatus endophyticus TaxID=1716077 RepID=A0A917W5B0_9ACTN|nr:hypothetical protein GCM10011575_30670 [Microlunatus endophyticus]
MPGLQRVRMSYDEWLALPEGPKAEWVDGEVVMNPGASVPHQDASFRLTSVLRVALPGLLVVQEVNVQLPNNRIRIADISVLDHAPESFVVTVAPRLVVEILSPSTRGEDTVRKSGEYAAAGIGQYWLLDPELYALDIYANESDGWSPLLHLDDHAPDGQVEVLGTTVVLRLADLLVIRS